VTGNAWQINSAIIIQKYNPICPLLHHTHIWKRFRI